MDMVTSNHMENNLSKGVEGEKNLLDKQALRSFLNMLQDLVLSNGQKLVSFWEFVVHHFQQKG